MKKTPDAHLKQKVQRSSTGSMCHLSLDWHCLCSRRMPLELKKMPLEGEGMDLIWTMSYPSHEEKLTGSTITTKDKNEHCQLK